MSGSKTPQKINIHAGWRFERMAGVSVLWAAGVW